MTEVTTNSLIAKYFPVSIVFSLLIAAMMAGGLYEVLVTGPAMRAAAQQQLTQTTLDENRAFCEKLGMRLGSGEFALCSQELAIVRQKQTRRDSAIAQGIL
jgi:hypothetical protein